MNVIRLLAVFSLGTLVSLLFPAIDSMGQEHVPDTPAAKRFTQLVEAVAAGGESLEAFLSDGFKERDEATLEQRKTQVEQVRSQLGTFKFKKVIESSDDEITVLCETSSGPNVLLTVIVDDDAPQLITSVQLETVDDEGEPDESPLGDDEKIATVQKLIKRLRANYVFPEVAEEMCADLEQSLESGAFDDVETTHNFAKTLTTQMRAICNDKHLRVRAGGIRNPSSKSGRRAPDNHGFVKAEILPGGIGYLKFNYFSGDKKAEATAAAAMNFLASSRALIIDLRQNGGGSPDMIAFLSGYLFDEKVHLNSFYNRPTETTTESWSRDDVPGKKLGESIPVYVLTSDHTFSGAEEFSYNLKNLKRGVIVGETTGGGAHPVMPVALGKRFSMSMPFARAINPITKTNWEGVGVKPDVEVSASSALDKAIELATAKLATSDDSANEKTVTGMKRDSSEMEAEALMNSQAFGKAAAAYEELVSLEPENRRAWFRLGYCLHGDGQLDKAIEIHKKVAEFDEFGPVATYNLGCAYSLKDQKALAFAALEQAIEQGFDDVGQFQSDTDLDNLREDERYKTLIRKLDGGF